MKATPYLIEKIKIKDKLYGIYGLPSKFKAIKYMPSVIVPKDERYYKIGDVVILLNFDYTTTVETCVIADESTLVNIQTLSEVIPDVHTSYIIGEDRYYYLSKEHPLNNISVVKDYEFAYNKLLEEFIENAGE